MVDEDQYWNDGDSIIDLSSEDEKSDAQAEWDESIRELQVILTTLVFPVLGRLVGRQFVLKSMKLYGQSIDLELTLNL
ncbi:hypothetical protein V1507DRAFT_468414 [Lipomyces tetrasporus]